MQCEDQAYMAYKSGGLEAVELQSRYHMLHTVVVSTHGKVIKALIPKKEESAWPGNPSQALASDSALPTGLFVIEVLARPWPWPSGAFVSAGCPASLPEDPYSSDLSIF